jgi:hypothetical protein
MPNQPQATRPRSREGMLAPAVPNDARSSTGKGTPCLVPACPTRAMGMSTITLPSITVSTACHHDMPWLMRLAARV